MSVAAFAGRVVLVTGGAASLGRGISENLASRGATVVIAERDAAGARGVESGMIAGGGQALGVDLVHAASLERMVRAVLERYGRIDGLVNNAGVLGPVKPIWETTDAELERVFDLNVRTVFLASDASSFITSTPLIVDGGWTAQ